MSDFVTEKEQSSALLSGCICSWDGEVGYTVVWRTPKMGCPVHDTQPAPRAEPVRDVRDDLGDDPDGKTSTGDPHGGDAIPPCHLGVGGAFIPSAADAAFSRMEQAPMDRMLPEDFTRAPLLRSLLGDGPPSGAVFRALPAGRASFIIEGGGVALRFDEARACAFLSAMMDGAKFVDAARDEAAD